MSKNKNALNKKQKEFLGMAISTARSKLYKEIIYSLTVECGKNICYRCEKIISCADNFSVDHKDDWRYKANAKLLFFDLKNIAFSHKSCNSAAVGGRRRKVGQTGYKGVIFCPERKSDKKYKACVYWKKVRHHVGYFMTAEEASIAYKEWVGRIQGSQAVDAFADE